MLSRTHWRMSGSILSVSDIAATGKHCTPIDDCSEIMGSIFGLWNPIRPAKVNQLVTTRHDTCASDIQVFFFFFKSLGVNLSRIPMVYWKLSFFKSCYLYVKRSFKGNSLNKTDKTYKEVGHIFYILSTSYCVSLKGETHTVIKWWKVSTSI